MTVGDILAIVGIVSAAFGALLWVIDHRVNRILHEIKPNGGSSMRDAVDRIEGKIDRHIEWHME
jgi:hypothetical protein